MNSLIFENLKKTVLIKDFSAFRKNDWLNFDNFNEASLNTLHENKHKILLEWNVRTKFSLVSLELSFYYKNYTKDKKCDIISSSILFDIEESKLLLESEIDISPCFIDRSYFNNSVSIALNDEESNLIQLYNRLFKKQVNIRHPYNHNVQKVEKLVFDKDNNINYIIKYAYYGIRNQVQTAMGLKGFYQCISTTTDEDFEEKLKSMIENVYILPILNKKIHELTDDDILVLEMNNT